MEPKVFLSHASEDKERFVIDFAEKLRQQGVDIWLDQWEMLPGDSLVDKIFEEGIKNATAVIVVLSKFSVDKPWVREELNAACVKRINTGSKLIPVVIDDCNVPEALKNTVWERIENFSEYESNLQRIVASIFGSPHKPPIGQPPKYVQDFKKQIGNLNDMDSLVLRLSCEAVLTSGDTLVNPGEVFLKDGDTIVPDQELLDSLEMLDRGHYIKALRTMGSGFFHYQVTSFGFESYAKTCIDDYQGKVIAVISAIVNKQLSDNFSLKNDLKQPQRLVDHVLDILEQNNHLKLAKTMGGQSQIYNVSPALKRALSEG